MSDMFFKRAVKVVKVDGDLGLVMGYAIVCTEEGEPYFDKQGDHIPDESMLEAALDFMENSRVAGEMHSSDSRGTVVFAWPLTADVAKAFGIVTNRTGLMVALRPSDDEMLDKFRDGTYTGFSIGGRRIEDEEVDDATR